MKWIYTLFVTQMLFFVNASGIWVAQSASNGGMPLSVAPLKYE